MKFQPRYEDFKSIYSPAAGRSPSAFRPPQTPPFHVLSPSYIQKHIKLKTCKKINSTCLLRLLQHSISTRRPSATTSSTVPVFHLNILRYNFNHSTRVSIHFSHWGSEGRERGVDFEANQVEVGCSNSTTFDQGELIDAGNVAANFSLRRRVKARNIVSAYKWTLCDTPIISSQNWILYLPPRSGWPQVYLPRGF